MLKTLKLSEVFMNGLMKSKKKKKEHEVINNKVEKIKIIEESIHTRNAVLTFF